MENWTEIKITVPVERVDEAGAIASMTVPYGIYIEDYSDLEEQAMAIAKIDLIDEELLQKDRTKGIVHIYISPEENPQEAVSFISDRLRAEGIDFAIDLGSCAREDWENNWKQYFKPIAVGKKLLIHPVWIEDYDAQGRIPLPAPTRPRACAWRRWRRISFPVRTCWTWAAAAAFFPWPVCCWGRRLPPAWISTGWR